MRAKTCLYDDIRNNICLYDDMRAKTCFIKYNKFKSMPSDDIDSLECQYNDAKSQIIGYKNVI